MDFSTLNGITFLSWASDFIVTDFIVTVKPLFFFLIFFSHQKSVWTVDFIVHRGVAREMLVSDFILNYG